MESAEGILNSLETKVKRLADLYVQIKNERDLLNNQSVIHRKTIEEQHTEIENLKSHIRALESEKPTEIFGEKGMVKEKIQGLVREIDRCIELLNK